MATKTIKTSGGDYTTLSGWEAGEQADITGLGPSIAECYAMSDTTAVTIDGWTTTASDYIKITVPSSERHAGVWNTGKYRLEVTGIGTSGILKAVESYVRVEYLQIAVDRNATNSAHAVYLTPTSTGDIRVSNCIIKSTGTAGRFNAGILADKACNYYIWNNIIYDFKQTPNADERGVLISLGTAYLYNNTVVDCDYGIWRSGGTLTAVNNLVSGSATACYNGTFTSSNYNASSSATATGGANDRVSQTFTFAGASDFHLSSSDAGAKDFGTSDPGSGLFSDDIDGSTRSGSWDIGADEYTVAGGTAKPWYAYAQQ